MKISNKTLDIMKNFSEINQSLVIKAGEKKFKSVSQMKNILAHAEVEEDFPVDFAIYNLNDFIILNQKLNNPELDFQEKIVVLTDVKTKVPAGYDLYSQDFGYADPNVVKETYPKKDIDMPDETINFTLLEQQYEQLKTMSSINKLNDILVKGCPTTNKIFLIVTNKKNISSNNFTMQVGEGVTESYKMYFKTENLKMVPGDYNVNISKDRISHFENMNTELDYWIAMEPDSKYGE